MQPVYGMLLGWSRAPQNGFGVMQHESGTKRLAFGRIRSVSLTVVFQKLSCHSSNRIAPQHLYWNEMEIEMSAGRTDWQNIGDLRLAASCQWLWNGSHQAHRFSWMFGSWSWLARHRFAFRRDRTCRPPEFPRGRPRWAKRSTEIDPSVNSTNEASTIGGTHAAQHGAILTKYATATPYAGYDGQYARHEQTIWNNHINWCVEQRDVLMFPKDRPHCYSCHRNRWELKPKA